MIFALLFALAVQQQHVTDVRGHAGIRSDDDATALVVGATYRPVGESAELQRLVAEQLEAGYAAELVSEAAGRRVRVNVHDSGQISVQMDLYAIAKKSPESYLTTYGPEMATSLLTAEAEFYRAVEEASGPEAALVLKAAFAVSAYSGIPTMAGVAIILSRDPEVRAATALLAADGADIRRALALAARTEGRAALQQFGVAATDLSVSVASAYASGSEQVKVAAREQWNALAHAIPQLIDQPSRSARETATDLSHRASGLVNEGLQRSQAAAENAYLRGRVQERELESEVAGAVSHSKKWMARQSETASSRAAGLDANARQSMLEMRARLDAEARGAGERARAGVEQSGQRGREVAAQTGRSAQQAAQDAQARLSTGVTNQVNNLKVWIKR